MQSLAVVVVLLGVVLILVVVGFLLFARMVVRLRMHLRVGTCLCHSTFCTLRLWRMPLLQEC